MAKIVKAPSMKKLASSYTEPDYKSEKARTHDPRPTFTISETSLPEIKSWNVDKEYDLAVRVEMIGINEKEYGSDKGKKAATFRVVSIGLNEVE